MSGFVLLHALDGHAVGEGEIHAVLPALRARGPHGHEHWLRESVAVATSLLDTGDPRLRARVARSDDRYLLAGHARIDDRDQLVRALTTAGRRVKSADSDIVLLAQGWAEWGRDFPARLLGDFSIVVHDARDQSVTAVRDHFGVRPLYFARTGTRLIVSNTLHAVLALPGVSKALNAHAITDFLVIGLNEEPGTTTFRDVRRVPPAHIATWRAGNEQMERYWSLPESAEKRLASARDYAEGFREVLATAVRERMRASAVSVFMSGGLDSTSLATLAARELRDGTARSVLHLVTQEAIFGLAADDVSRARVMAAHLALPHTILTSNAHASVSTEGASGLTRPEPYDDLDVARWQALLATAARFGPVVFYGEDPDALLLPPDLVTMMRSVPAARLARAVMRYVLAERRRPHLGLRDTARRVLGLSRTASDVPPWLRTPLRTARVARVKERRAAVHRTRPRTARALANPLWQSLLEALDAGSHGLPLEARLPFLDLRVIEYALAVPAVPWTQRKRLLREAMSGLIPDVVRLAPKQGLAGYQEARIAEWWASRPSRFVPSDALAEFVDPSALPVPSATTTPHDMMLHFRVRLLDRWLREQGLG